MKRSDDSTHPCRGPTPTVNGCDLTTSEQEYIDLTPVTRSRQHRTEGAWR